MTAAVLPGADELRKLAEADTHGHFDAETGAPEGRSVKNCCFTVDVPDLVYRAGTVGFSPTDVAIYPTYGEAASLEEFTARGCTVLRIDTNETNTPARRLYASLGYREVGAVPCEFNGIPNVNLVCLEKAVQA